VSCKTQQQLQKQDTFDPIDVNPLASHSNIPFFTHNELEVVSLASHSNIPFFTHDELEVVSLAPSALPPVDSTSMGSAGHFRTFPLAMTYWRTLEIDGL
jgi:hypothetical protein